MLLHCTQLRSFWSLLRKGNAMLKKVLAIAAFACAAVSANATVTVVTANTDASTFVDLTAPGAITGGTLRDIGTSVSWVALSPAGAISPGKYFAVGGPDNGVSATGFFTPQAGTYYVSFLWGSPDSFNTVTIVSGGFSNFFEFKPGPSGVVPVDPAETASYWVGFSSDEAIDQVAFTSESWNQQDPGKAAFEVANISVTAPIPEPETYALMLAGLGLMGFIARRRRAD